MLKTKDGKLIPDCKIVWLGDNGTVADVSGNIHSAEKDVIDVVLASNCNIKLEGGKYILCSSVDYIKEQDGGYLVLDVNGDKHSASSGDASDYINDEGGCSSGGGGSVNIFSIDYDGTDLTRIAKMLDGDIYMFQFTRPGNDGLLGVVKTYIINSGVALNLDNANEEITPNPDGTVDYRIYIKTSTTTINPIILPGSFRTLVVY